MTNIKLDRFDVIQGLVAVLRDAEGQTRYNRGQFMSDIVKRKTDYFTEENWDLRRRDWVLLSEELRNFFLQQTDPKLQDRFANYLIDLLHNDFGPLFKHMSLRIKEYSEEISKETGGRSYSLSENPKYVDQWLVEQMGVSAQSWMCIVCSHVKTFAPELYAMHSSNLDWMLLSKVHPEYRADFPEPLPEEQEKPTFKTLPPKVLLLYQLGFFKLPEVQKLSWESKGKLVSALCGGNADNAVDYIRQCDPDRISLGKNPYRNSSNVKAVQDLLDELNKS